MTPRHRPDADAARGAFDLNQAAHSFLMQNTNQAQFSHQRNTRDNRDEALHYDRGCCSNRNSVRSLTSIYCGLGNRCDGICHSRLVERARLYYLRWTGRHVVARGAGKKPTMTVAQVRHLKGRAK